MDKVIFFFERFSTYYIQTVSEEKEKRKLTVCRKLSNLILFRTIFSGFIFFFIAQRGGRVTNKLLLASCWNEFVLWDIYHNEGKAIKSKRIATRVKQNTFRSTLFIIFQSCFEIDIETFKRDKVWKQNYSCLRVDEKREHVKEETLNHISYATPWEVIDYFVLDFDLMCLL